MTILTWVGLRGRHLVAGLILAAAATFLVGIGVEHATSSTHVESAAETSTASTQSQASSSAAHGDSDAGGVEQPHRSQPAAAAGHTEPTATSEEHITLAGVSIPAEAPLTVASAAVASLILAAAVVLRRERWILGLVVIVVAGFAVVDCAELAHQVTEARPGVATLAAVTKALHIAAVGIACVLLVVATQSRRLAARW